MGTSRRQGTVFYGNGTDDEGRPIKHTRIPDDFHTWFSREVKKIVIEELEYSGFPEKREDRQKLMGFIKSLKSFWWIVLGALVAVCVPGVILGIVFIIQLMAKYNAG